MGSAAGRETGRPRPFGVALYEFLRFGAKQAWACLFGGLMCALLLGTHWWYPKDALLARYDFLTLAALGIQAALLLLRMETWAEAKVILMFHAVGTVMEIFKTSAGSWIYPEANLLRIGGVPLFTGFMYAAVGSYLARVWRLFDFRFRAHPPLATLALSALIYANFFAHHFIADFRLLLFALTALLFGRAWVYFRIWREYRRMPLLLGFVLVALFIWFAENIGTFANAWRYPNQSGGWEMVSIAAGLLVPADDHQLCDGQRGEPPRGHLGRPCCRNAARGRGIGRIWRVPYFLSRSGLRLAGQ